MGEASQIHVDRALPLLLPVAYGLVMLLFAPTSRRDSRWLGVFAAIGMAVCSAIPVAILRIRSLAELPISTGGETAARIVFIDRPSLLLSALISAVGLSALLMEAGGRKRSRWMGEIYSLHFFLLAGLMIVVHTENLLMLFVGVETIFIASLVLGSILRRDTPGLRSSLEYFVIGHVGAGFAALGTALVFSLTGAFSYTGLTDELLETPGTIAGLGPEALLAGLALILAGLAVQGALPPFHAWRARALETATPSISIIRLVAVPLAVAGVLDRMTVVIRRGASGLVDHWVSVLSLMSILALGYGAISIIRRKTLRGLVESTAIVYMGFFLAATVLASPGGGRDLFLQMLTASGGMIALVVLSGSLDPESGAFTEHSSGTWYRLWRRKRSAAIAVLIPALSLSGLMPAGLWFRRHVFVEAMERGRIALLIALVFAGAVVAVYYARVVVSVFGYRRKSGIASTRQASDPHSEHFDREMRAPALPLKELVVLAVLAISIAAVDVLEGMVRWYVR